MGARRAIRRAVGFDCELVSARVDQPLGYRVTDLSTHGLWIQTPDPVRAGEEVVVCFEPGEGWCWGELMVFAEVARVATSRERSAELGSGMGLEFLDLTRAEQGALAMWLAARRSPVPRRRRPVRRFELPHPRLSRSFDEIGGTTALTAVHAAGPKSESPDMPASVEPASRPRPVTFRPLQAAWR
ncbi:MAG: PilZ domain-containing protein [Myxococcales bacterium]|nr:PilZ domain-containing protein [Myxococcales bacterium]